MQLTNLALLGLASSAFAAPAAIPLPGDKFGLVSISTTKPIHNTGITAAHGFISIGGTQDGYCVKPSKFATFWVKKGKAYLYSTSAPYQQLWVDRMGGGAVGYTTGAQQPPTNAQTNLFAVTKEGHLTFDGQEPQACPPISGQEAEGWSVWWTEGVMDGCVSITLKAVKTAHPISCTYSSGD